MSDLIVGKIIGKVGSERLEFQDHLSIKYDISVRTRLSFILKAINYLCELFSQPRWIKLQYKDTTSTTCELYINVNSLAKRTLLLPQDFLKNPNDALAELNKERSPEQLNAIRKVVRELANMEVHFDEKEITIHQLYLLRNHDKLKNDAVNSKKGIVKIRRNAHVPYSTYIFSDGKSFSSIKIFIGKGRFKTSSRSIYQIQPENIKTVVKLKSPYSKSPQAKHLARNETFFLQKLNKDPDAKEFVPELYATFQRSESTYHFVEGCDKNDLACCIKNNLLTEDDKKQIFQDTVKILLLLKKHGIVHTDFKPHNLLTYRDPSTGKRRLKVTDFGLAHLVGCKWTRSGTPAFMSPEMLKARDEGTTLKATFSMDMYAAGLILLRMLKGYEYPDERPDNDSDPYLKIIAEMMDPEPSTRITPEKIIVPIPSFSSESTHS